MNENMCKLMVNNFSKAMRMFNLVDDNDDLKKDLMEDELFMEDLRNTVSSSIPSVPHAGFVSGGMSTAKHVYNHKQKVKNEPIPKPKRADIPRENKHDDINTNPDNS